MPRPPARPDEAPIRAAPIAADDLASTLNPGGASVAELGDAALGTKIGNGEDTGTGTGRGDGSGSGRGRGRQVSARWVRMPTSKEMAPYWPPKALAAKLSGRAILECIVPRTGPPRSCRAIGEAPLGSGFGQAAVAMSPTFRIVPVTRGRQVEDMPIIVPVVFSYKGK